MNLSKFYQKWMAPPAPRPQVHEHCETVNGRSMRKKTILVHPDFDDNRSALMTVSDELETILSKPDLDNVQRLLVSVPPELLDKVRLACSAIKEQLPAAAQRRFLALCERKGFNVVASGALIKIEETRPGFAAGSEAKRLFQLTKAIQAALLTNRPVAGAGQRLRFAVTVDAHELVLAERACTLALEAEYGSAGAPPFVVVGDGPGAAAPLPDWLAGAAGDAKGASGDDIAVSVSIESAGDGPAAPAQATFELSDAERQRIVEAASEPTTIGTDGPDLAPADGAFVEAHIVSVWTVKERCLAERLVELANVRLTAEPAKQVLFGRYATNRAFSDANLLPVPGRAISRCYINLRAGAKGMQYSCERYDKDQQRFVRLSEHEQQFYTVQEQRLVPLPVCGEWRYDKQYFVVIWKPEQNAHAYFATVRAQRLDKGGRHE